MAREGQMSICLQRREFIAGLGGAAAAWPLTAAGQQQKPIIGWLRTRPGVPDRDVIDGFRRGLAEAGFIENKNVLIEFRWANSQFGQLPSLVSDLINRQVAVIFAASCGRPSVRSPIAC